MEATRITKNEIISVLTRSEHGNLEAYRPISLAAAQAEPEFLAHLIAWNHEKGAIRDSKVAIPVYSLATPTFTGDLAENSLAHVAMLDPRNFVRALEAARAVGLPGRGRSLRRLVERYLRSREASYGLWERAVIQHRASIKTLYARWHVKPGAEIFDKALFKGQPPVGSTLHVISQLGTMPPKEALGHVLNRRIPFLVAAGALGSKLHDADVVLALINSMSATELTTNAKMLERLGVKTNPALRAAFQAGLQKAVESASPASLLKTGVAAKAVGGELGAKLAGVQERQIKASGGIKGRWLVLGDKSQSMHASIEVAKFVAAHLARFAEECHLLFFDAEPSYYRNVTGMPLEEIKEVTKYIQSGGGTSIFCGLEYLRQRRIEVDGIAVISDGGENRPQYLEHYWEAYVKMFDKEPTLYHFKVRGDPNRFGDTLNFLGIGYEEFDLTRGVDYYSLPNLIQTMQTRRWGLVDQIMETPLKKLDEVFTTERS